MGMYESYVPFLQNTPILNGIDRDGKRADSVGLFFVSLGAVGRCRA